MSGSSDMLVGRRPRIAIIGGGLAGMSAAETLIRSGAELVVTLLESRRITGGRAGSFLDPYTGEAVDYCQHVAMGCCTNLLGMMHACGLEDAFARYDRLSFFHATTAPATASTFGASSWLPAPFHLLPSLRSLEFLSASQRRQVRRATWRLMRSRAEELQPIIAFDWLRRNGQSAATIEQYWNVVIASALGESCESVSMAAVRKVFVDGFLSARGASDVLVPREPLRELFGVRMPNAIRSLGVSVVTQAAVRSVRLIPGTPLPVRLEIDLGDTQIQVNYAILAVPWHQLQKIIDPALAERAALPLDLWAAFPASPISGVHLWFDRPIMHLPHAVLVGSLAQWVFRRPEEATAAQPDQHYYQVVISAAHQLRQMSHEQIVKQVVADLAAVLPGVRPARLLRSRVVTDPQSVFSIRPEVDAARPTSSTALPCLHLAGDFVQTGWPATMEGAVISGRQAANGVLRNMGYRGSSISRGLPHNWLSRLLIRH
jgi:squalene-associated FAD-dependent desaturase